MTDRMYAFISDKIQTIKHTTSRVQFKRERKIGEELEEMLSYSLILLINSLYLFVSTLNYSLININYYFYFIHLM